MSTASLMVYPESAAGKDQWSFDHAMAHRQVMAVMGPLKQWSVMPYFVDPEDFAADPASKWRLNHQQAHQDFTHYLPSYQTALQAGIPGVKNLIDSDNQRPGERAWWTHNNHQEHIIASNAILPLPLTAPQLPWWALPPRLVQIYW